MKKHYARYTPEMVERVCGTPKEQVLQICELIASTATPTRAMTIMYALGWTQHSIGSQMIRTGAMVQLLLGNIGIAGGGMNALRGHSNIQGLTDLGTAVEPACRATSPCRAKASRTTRKFIAARALKPLRPNQMSYWQNTPKFHVSLMKAWWGNAATAENNWAYDYLPKLDKLYDMLQVFELMHQGKINGYLPGLQSAGRGPEQGQDDGGVGEAQIPGHHGSAGHRDLGVLAQLRRAQRRRLEQDPDRSVPPADHLLRRGRTARWSTRRAGCSGIGRAPIRRARRAATSKSWPASSRACARMYAKDGGAFPDPILNLTWPYAQPDSPDPEELAKEYTGKALKDLADPKDPDQDHAQGRRAARGICRTARRRQHAERLLDFLRRVGPTGNLMARRDNSDPTGIGQTLNWAWAWPANRRVLYNRASCDPAGKPFDPEAQARSRWNGRPGAAPTFRTSRPTRIPPAAWVRSS